MERCHYQKCIRKCVVRFHDTIVVYAGLDGGSVEVLTVFLYLFYSGADLSWAVKCPGNCAEMCDSAIVDWAYLFYRGCALAMR